MTVTRTYEEAVRAVGESLVQRERAANDMPCATSSDRKIILAVLDKLIEDKESFSAAISVAFGVPTADVYSDVTDVIVEASPE